MKPKLSYKKGMNYKFINISYILKADTSVRNMQMKYNKKSIKIFFRFFYDFDIHLIRTKAKFQF